MASKFIKVDFGSGIHRESTQYAEDGKWYNADRVRFRSGKPENLRGFETKVSSTFDGNARDLITWQDNNQFKRALWGTEQKLYEHNGDQIFDITPVSVSVTLANVFGTSIGSTRVCVSDGAHGRKTGDFVFFTSAAVIGSDVTLNDVYSVSVINTNVYAIEVSGAAGATSTQTGSATFHYLIATGSENAVAGLGYGAAGYNAGVSIGGARAWNQPTSTGASDFVSEITQWSLDNWGEDVIASRRGGTIYYWDTDASTTPIRAIKVSGTTNSTPTTVNSILVSPNDRHLIALGSNEFKTTASTNGDFNPLTVRWSDQEDYTNWIPSVSSTSGEVLLTDGTRIVGGIRSRNAINIFTDNSMWQMQFVGPPFTFSFNQVGTNCGLISPHSGVDYDGRTYWMDYDNFYVFDGTLRKLECTVRRYVFDNLNFDQKDKVFCGVNSEFTEIIWLYPSKNSTECDSYVIFSPEENYWTIGTCFWTTFADKTVFGNTITTGTTVGGSNLYNNEPTDIYTGNGQALKSVLESGDFEIDDGNSIMFLDRIIPDFDMSNGTIQFSISTKQYPESTEIITKGPFTIGSSTQKINLRARGRQARVKVSCESTGTKWRWGSVRVGVQPDGGR
jgi:hypothetical protein|tara:strand:- start:3692 stop:5542 length:1851 start_codon:yes stop_codon:yes gene_type:complete